MQSSIRPPRQSWTAWLQRPYLAFAAHVGGFVTGLGLLPILRMRKKLDYDAWESWRRGARLG